MEVKIYNQMNYTLMQEHTWLQVAFSDGFVCLLSCPDEQTDASEEVRLLFSFLLRSLNGNQVTKQDCQQAMCDLTLFRS